MNITTLKKAVFDWVTLALTPPPSGLVVYWDHPNAPRPQSPCIKLKFINGPTMIGIDELRDDPDSDDGHLVVGLRSFTLSVNAYGETAQDLISKLQSSVSHPAKVEALSADGVSILSFGPTRDVSTPLETRTETRHQVDVNLLASEYETTEAGIIEEATIEGEIEAEDGDTIPIEISNETD